jgi:hypothetical protein
MLPGSKVKTHHITPKVTLNYGNEVRLLNKGKPKKWKQHKRSTATQLSVTTQRHQENNYMFRYVISETAHTADE